MRSYAVAVDFPYHLLERLARTHRVMGPVVGTDGVCRLQEVARWDQITLQIRPLLPPKKVLLPSRDLLWTLSDNRYAEPRDAAPAIALVGIPSCDLYGIEYLDRVFADDALYRRRRERVLLVGAQCEADSGCFCPPRSQPPSCDLFLAPGRLFSATAAGEEVLAPLAKRLSDSDDRPFPEEAMAGRGTPPPDDLESRFQAADGALLWRQTGQRCLSCGACSAVCPTCYCYDVVDETLPDGTVNRVREWDNCFFRNHALVAGGHNFRPDRTERLRFRFEHKLLGFGALRGVPSCVGCGRCGRACPVDIDIAELLDQLVAGERT